MEEAGLPASFAPLGSVSDSPLITDCPDRETDLTFQLQVKILPVFRPHRQKT